MLGSTEKLNFIITYMSAYQNKIRMANKYGLFDEAKLFELFAKEVCTLWFGQEFKNLNVNTFTYPYVDLISEDQKLFVQVGTAQDLSVKISTTLRKIRDSKDGKFTSLHKLVFFMLSQEKIDEVKDYSGANQIGSLSFTRKDNLITTDDVIQKAQDDPVFLDRLYDVLKGRFDGVGGQAEKINEAMRRSRDVGLGNIDGLIHGEYEIDRSALVRKIQKDGCQFLSIQGGAGSGKSALCKKLVGEEEVVLYARAERFLEESHIDAIWGCNIRHILTYLNGKRIVFFIDALEFIADSPVTKFELLQDLYTAVKEYDNAFILTSLRSSDKNAFLRLESCFSIQVYEIEDLTEGELIPIMAKYPVIRKMHDMKSYSDLLKIPFYINLAVSRQVELDDISDENSFREYIWQNVICLRDKVKRYGVTYDEVAAAIGKIAFERAKKFSLGIAENEVNGNVVHALFAEGVISKQGRETIRLKYDIFEDICFEHYFDRIFDDCKGEYRLFYDEIEGLGRCVYRRYQIWVSNKLFMQANRDKFLYRLIFSDDIQEKWRKQTGIGIVKSRYCDDFFAEYAADFIDRGMLPEFVDTTNLYGFEAKIENIKDESPLIRLNPVGNGRPCLIRLLEGEKIYRTGLLKKEDIVKLCLDYSRQRNRDKQIISDVCVMMEYYVEQETGRCLEGQYYYFIDRIKSCLEAIYNMTDVSECWIKDFWQRLEKDCRSGDVRKERMAQDTIKWTLQNAEPALMKKMAEKLCLLADVYWLEEETREGKARGYFSYDAREGAEYGLSEQGEYYRGSYRNILQNKFLSCIFWVDFEEGLRWAVRFVNRTIETYVKNDPSGLVKVKVRFLEGQLEREYWGSNDLWLAGIKENSVPVLIGDIIYSLRKTVIMRLELCQHDREGMRQFADEVKGTLYSESNNIALLTIIESVGMQFERELPGYLLDLATCMELIYWDVSRVTLYADDPTLNLLKKQIFMSAGVPNIRERYPLDTKGGISLRDYVCHAQVWFDCGMKERCYHLLDYLYSITPNDAEHAVAYLQIQRMDLRGAEAVRVDENYIAFHCKATGEADKIVREQKKADEPMARVEQIAREISESMLEDDFDTGPVIRAIGYVVKKMAESDMPVRYENTLVRLIAAALQSRSLGEKERETLCDMWIKGVKQFLTPGIFVFDTKLFRVLLHQLDFDMASAVKNELKKLVLDCLLNTEDNGRAEQLAGYVKLYLRTNRQLARAVFYTVIKLSEEKRNRQRFHTGFPKGQQQEGEYADDSGGQNYESRKESIVNRYLLQEENPEIGEPERDCYDLSTLCYAANCGLDFEDEEFRRVMHHVLIWLVELWKYNEEKDIHDGIYGFSELEIVELYQREMIQAPGDAGTAIDMLFEGMDFSGFPKEAVRFYQEILGNFLPEYFDAYKDPRRRKNCQKKLLYIEEKVKAIRAEHVRRQLYKPLMLTVTNSCGDWSRFKTSYSFADKQFLNGQFTKYGRYYIKELLETIYQLHMDELLPEILVSVRDSLQGAIEDGRNLENDLKERKTIVDLMILKPFLKYSDELKQDQELLEAYEDILELLSGFHYENAAVVLDEFRVH